MDQQTPKEAQGDEELTVKVEDDAAPAASAPEASTPAPVKPASADADEDAELAQYSESVQKRIKQLTKLRREEERAKSAAEKDREEALRIAQAVWAENKQLKERLAKGETALGASVTSAAAAEVAAAKTELKEAMEAYDAEKIVEAQEKLQRAVLREAQAKHFQARTARQPQEPQEPVRQAPEAAPTAKPDPKAAEWQDQNSWFGKDEEMTAFALGLHNRLTREHGPAYATTDEYYERINARVREKFPENFGGQGTQPESNQRPATVVAPATRSVPPKQITLTKRQAEIARRLNVPLDLYAKQLAALENGNG